MADSVEVLSLKTNQIAQILDQYRKNMYQLELRYNLLQKMLAEHGVFAEGEFDKRWPQYLQKDVGMPGPDGRMDGYLKVTFYNEGVMA